MNGNEFNKEEIKKRVKEKIKERMTKELIEEVYKELKLETNELIDEITSLIDTDMISTVAEDMSKDSSAPLKIKKSKAKIEIDIKPILKIASHSLKYANPRINKSQWVEVIGLLAGQIDKNTGKLYIRDAFPMGHGTALNAEIKDYKNYERAYRDITKNGLFICGWYHSHPSYGTFMSMEDLITQSRYQKLWDEAIALVIDPTEVDGNRYGFNIFKANLKLNKWYEVPFEIRGDLKPSLLPELIDFINPIVDGKAIYLEYDEE